MSQTKRHRARQLRARKEQEAEAWCRLLGWERQRKAVGTTVFLHNCDPECAMCKLRWGNSFNTLTSWRALRKRIIRFQLTGDWQP